MRSFGHLAGISLIALLLATTVTVPVAAQAASPEARRPAAPPPPDPQVLFAGLELSADQLRQLTAITEQARKRRDALGLSRGSLSQAQARELQAIAADQRRAVESVLNDGQRQRLQDNIARVRAQQTRALEARGDSSSGRESRGGQQPDGGAS